MTREDLSMKTQEFGHKDDELLFADEVIRDRRKSQHVWKVLIADDEEEVHAVTRMVLDNFIFEGRGLMLLSAYSGVETKHLLQEHPDMAIVLLDVVMEEETTGLEVVRYIRKDLRNRFVRIVLRTGQPGQAPEGQVTVDYDITVVNIFDLARAHPVCVDMKPRLSEIKLLLKSGVEKIPGVNWKQIAKSSVRGGKVIDV